MLFSLRLGLWLSCLQGHSQEPYSSPWFRRNSASIIHHTWSKHRTPTWQSGPWRTNRRRQSELRKSYQRTRNQLCISLLCRRQHNHLRIHHGRQVCLKPGYCEHNGRPSHHHAWWRLGWGSLIGISHSICSSTLPSWNLCCGSSLSILFGSANTHSSKHWDYRTA